MSKITSQMFSEDDGTVKEKLPADLVAKIIQLSMNDPADFKPDARRANLILIRRMAKKLSKSL